jgi:uncharacterized membrane protein
MKQEKLLRETQFVSFILIGLAIIAFVIIIFQLVWRVEKPENFGVVGDAIGGIMNPIVAIAAALLTFMAFYIQKLANDELKDQFLQQKKDEHEDFIFKNFKDRIQLLINEVNTFNISFHNGTLISGTNLLNEQNAKKYNFIGIQAINLFLVEYFNLKEMRRAKGESTLLIEESYHAILLNINNLITAFYNIHIAVEQATLEADFKAELIELLSYTYYSKFNYFFEYLRKQHLHLKINGQIDYIYKHYEAITKQQSTN